MFINELSRNEHFRVNPSAFEALKEYNWPGNVRELRNVIERAMIFTDNRTIDDVIIYKSLNISTDSLLEEIKPKFDLEKLKRAELITVIKDTLRVTKGNKTEAAKSLNVHYTTFYRWVKKFNLEDSIPKAKLGRPKLSLSHSEASF
jgi:transcriptional regulator with PAS, ATPase and Fis domain